MNRKDLQALTFVEPPVTRPVPDPPAVLKLENLLHILRYYNLYCIGPCITFIQLSFSSCVGIVVYVCLSLIIYHHASSFHALLHLIFPRLLCHSDYFSHTLTRQKIIKRPYLFKKPYFLCEKNKNLNKNNLGISIFLFFGLISYLVVKMYLRSCKDIFNMYSNKVKNLHKNLILRNHSLFSFKCTEGTVYFIFCRVLLGRDHS